MKATHLASVLAVSAVMLAGCASQNQAARATIPHDIDDASYVATVESYDRAHGIHVTWVNPPQKRVPDQASAGNASD
jgi:type IV pilus biogenesis protein CpaD/CtpE